GTHTSFERLAGERLVREHADEELAETLGLALDRHTASLDLTRGQVAALHRLQCVVAERHVAADVCQATTLALLLLAILGALGLKHDIRPYRAVSAPAPVESYGGAAAAP